MSTSKYYSLSWDFYQSGICKGFADQQNNQEFVDMTLVADGHLVKVHKNLICLASSFIKHMIKSTPCEHPIIFLNNVSHETLCYLLEYIYTGEVKVGEDKLQAVLRVANELKICGLEKLIKKRPTPQVSEAAQISVTSTSKAFTASTNILPVQRNAYAVVSNENITEHTNGHQPNAMSVDHYDHCAPVDHCSLAQDPENGIYLAHDAGVATALRPDDLVPDETTSPTEPPGTPPVTNITIDTTGSLPQQYSVSTRGLPQLLLHRFVYNLHHQAQCGRRRRWRCCDYRRARCAAYVDTLDDNITLRKNIHHHEHHDDMILKKVRSNRVFGSLQETTRAVFARHHAAPHADSHADSHADPHADPHADLHADLHADPGPSAVEGPGSAELL